MISRDYSDSFSERDPVHMQYPGLWELADQVRPDLLADYLSWVAAEDTRLESAADAMQWLPVGFYTLLVARDKDPLERKVNSLLQLNFYREDYAGNEHPHTHARDARTTWYAPEDVRQHITRWLLLSPGAEAHELPLTERHVMTNTMLDSGEGKRPIYHPLIVGRRLLTELSHTEVATFGSQQFGSLEIHHVGMEGEGVALSVHYKGDEESSWFSTIAGLTQYKGLVEAEARAVSAERDRLQVAADNGLRVGPTTLIFPPLDYDMGSFEQAATKPKRDQAVELLLGGLATSTKLAK